MGTQYIILCQWGLLKSAPTTVHASYAEQRLQASCLGQCVVTSVTLKLIFHHLEPGRLSGVYWPVHKGRSS
jgi:hypothetical protein